MVVCGAEKIWRSVGISQVFNILYRMDYSYATQQLIYIFLEKKKVGQIAKYT